MNLNEYPQAIAKLQRQTLRLDRRIRKMDEYISSCYFKIDLLIAFDVDLKNESQRKAKKQQLIDENIELISAELERQEIKDKRADVEVNLQLLRNEFSVLKLERREAIVSLELQAAS